jgi:hypothetical protein
MTDPDALQRKHDAISADMAELRQRITERAAAFSSDKAEQRDYRRTLIMLLVGEVLRPLLSDAEGHRRIGALMDALRKEMREKTAQRKRIEGLVADLGLAVDDAFDV